jgi:CubicO group peptidase (beta-lactamase class C family)
MVAAELVERLIVPAVWSVRSAAATWIQAVAAADANAPPLLRQLDPRQRARVLMALLGIVLAGVGLIVLAILGGRYVLRLARKRIGPTPPEEDRWYRKSMFETGSASKSISRDAPSDSDDRLDA